MVKYNMTGYETIAYVLSTLSDIDYFTIQISDLETFKSLCHPRWMYNMYLSYLDRSVSIGEAVNIYTVREPDYLRVDARSMFRFMNVDSWFFERILNADYGSGYGIEVMKYSQRAYDDTVIPGVCVDFRIVLPPAMDHEYCIIPLFGWKDIVTPALVTTYWDDTYSTGNKDADMLKNGRTSAFANSPGIKYFHTMTATRASGLYPSRSPRVVRTIEMLTRDMDANELEIALIDLNDISATVSDDLPTASEDEYEERDDIRTAEYMLDSSGNHHMSPYRAVMAVPAYIAQMNKRGGWSIS